MAIVKSVINHCWWCFKWGLLAALAVAVVLGVRFYTRLDDEVRQRVEARLAENYPHLTVTVRSAQLVSGQGIEVRGLSILDPAASGPGAELLFIDELLLCCSTDLTELAGGTPNIGGLVVRRPTLRATRDEAGAWSLARLLPLPKCGGGAPPRLSIEDATLEIADSRDQGAAPVVFRQINLQIKPADADGHHTAGELLDVHGHMTSEFCERIEVSGRVDRTSGQWSAGGTLAGWTFSPEIRRSLPREAAEPLAALASLRCEGDAEFHLSGGPTRGGKAGVAFTVNGQIRSGRFEDPRLPLPLTDLQAQFRADNSGVVIDKLTARNGQTLLTLSGATRGWTRQSPLELEADVRHLLIGRSWERVLSEPLLAQWRKFLPAGEVDARLRLAFDGHTWRPDLEVRCLNVSFTYFRFPYRLDKGTGTLLFQDDTLTLDLVAQAGSRPVKIDGRFHNPGPAFTGEVRLRGLGMPLDEELLAALPEKSRDVVRSLAPSGLFDFVFQAGRDDAANPRVSQHMIVTLKECGLRYDRFRYPLNHVSGELEMIDGRWTFHHLEGRNDSGRVTCSGSLTPTATGAELDLQFRGTNIVLDEELRDALQPRAIRLWNDLKPRGAIDLTANVHYLSAEKRLDVRVRVEPIAEITSIHPVFFPYRLEKLRGAFLYRDGHVDFENLRAVHDRTPVASGGFCDFDSAGNWHVRFERLTVDRLKADRDLLLALPVGLKTVVTTLKPTGPVNISGTFDLWGGPPPEPVRAAWDADFDLQQGSLECGVSLSNVCGSVRLTGDYDGRRVRSRGELAIDSLTYNQLQFTELFGPIWIDDTQVVLGSAAVRQEPNKAPRRLTARLYGGVIMADGWVTLHDTPRYSLQATLTDAELNRFAGEFLPGRQRLQGRVLGAVDLTGTAAGLHTLAGRGQVRLREADIYELPLMVALLKILSIRSPDTNAFTTSDIQFRLEGDHVYLDKIEFSGDAISLVGNGEMNLDTDIRLKFHSMVGRSELQLPILKNVLGQASQQLMLIHVEGTLADPKTTREAFPTLNQALQQLQTEMAPRSGSLPTPTPAFSNRPPPPKR